MQDASQHTGVGAGPDDDGDGHQRLPGHRSGGGAVEGGAWTVSCCILFAHDPEGEFCSDSEAAVGLHVVQSKATREFGVDELDPLGISKTTG